MKVQSLILATVATYTGVSEAALCWTNGLNLLMGGQPWGAGCNQPPVNPITQQQPQCVPTTVTVPVPTTVSVSTTIYAIHPTAVASASGVCMGLNPPRTKPLFDENGAPACCGPVIANGAAIC
ncbi:hypothetical protein B0I37DRAFT_219157 [Chaetomium sp. MPI-CAGE-AT-0009]|nr:hypothetical protein B0I37DRAFT_219157 [Chaetomium sp. MPI-CAGE-AT-0009]